MMRRHALLPCLALLLLFGSAETARAAVAIESFAFTTSSIQAGAHTNLSASLALEKPGEPEVAKDALIDLPPGGFLYAESLPHCSSAAFVSDECPVSAQVGVVTIRGGHEGNPNFLLGTAPVYLLTAEGGELARIGFIIPTVDTPVAASLRVPAGAAQRMRLAFEGLPEAVPLKSFALTLWGVPASPVHDEERFPGEPRSCPGSETASCIPSGTPSSQPQVPFTRNPTSCSSANAALAVDSHQHPGDFASTSAAIFFSGCGKLAFGPSLGISLTNTETSAPTGLGVQVSMPADLAPQDITGSDLEAFALELPPGLTLDEEAAADLEACTVTQAHLDGSGPVECPPGSSVGTVAVTLPEIGPIEGQAYFGGTESAGSYRLFLVASGFGIDLRLAATLVFDAETETASISLPSLPQLPVTKLLLSVEEASGLFLTPSRCGEYEAIAEFTPWSSPSSRFVAGTGLEIDVGPEGGPCPGPAEEVAVSLAPASLPADGHSTSVATATVYDEHGYQLAGEEVIFFSTDPNQKIGPVTDNGDGTYAATITASTAPGTATISAIDESVEPGIVGAAALIQLGPPALPAPPGPPPAQPIVSFRRHPSHRTRDRTPTFRFASSVPGSSFACRIDRHRMRACESPLTFPRLGFGRHTFEVVAVAAGVSSKPLSYAFVVRRRT